MHGQARCRECKVVSAAIDSTTYSPCSFPVNRTASCKMADSSPKPAAPSGDGPAPQPATPPAPSDPVQDTQTASTSAAASEPASLQSDITGQQPTGSTPEGSSSTGRPAPGPEASAIQGAGQQDGTTLSTQQTHVPSLPPKNYPRDPRWLTYGTLPAALPSRVLPRFFKALAVLIFLTGTSATLLTIIYQVSGV
jgi:hypothetical protein